MSERRPLVKLARALGVALVLATGSVAAEGPFPGDDATITAAVQLKLWTEGSLAGTDIRVETSDGAVTLRGFAGTMEDIATAGRLARAVRGVRGVFNAIRVAVRPSRA
jgi:osmotically-inducible protein OsmY